LAAAIIGGPPGAAGIIAAALPHHLPGRVMETDGPFGGLAGTADRPCRPPR